MGCSLVLFKIPDGHNLTKTLYNQRNSRSKSLKDFIKVSKQCSTKIEKLETLKQNLITSIRDFINENLKHEEQIRNYCSTCELLRSCNQQLENYRDYIERCNAFIQLLKEKKSSRSTNYNRHNRSVTNNAGQQGKTPVKTDYKDDTILSTTREGVWERSVHV